MNAWSHKLQFGDPIPSYQPPGVERPYTDLRNTILGQQLFLTLDEAEEFHRRMVMYKHREDLLSMNQEAPSIPEKPKKAPVEDKDLNEKVERGENQTVAENIVKDRVLAKRNEDKIQKYGEEVNKPQSTHERDWEHTIRSGLKQAGKIGGAAVGNKALGEEAAELAGDYLFNEQEKAKRGRNMLRRASGIDLEEPFARFEL